MREWRDELKASWAVRERKWIKQALSTWLYALGMVELGFDEGELVSFRLTQLGREVLHPHLASASATPAEAAPEAWVVQPNFDVVVYLDRATPAQLAMLLVKRH